MTYTRRNWALPALALTLMLASCSTPSDLSAPTLEPQFGTSDDDQGVDVALFAGRAYSLAGQFDEDGNYGEALLRRYEANGTLTWTREVASKQCSEEEYGCGGLSAWALKANASHTYALVMEYGDVGDCGFGVYSSVYKFDAAGNKVSSLDVGVNGYSFGGDNTGAAFEYAIDMAVDGAGNIYVARQKVDFSNDYCDAARSNVIAKYSTNGTLLWQRPSTVGTPKGITVSGSGSVYVVGNSGFARYTNGGGLTWTKPGTFEEVIVSGSNLYTRYRKDIRKYDGTGKQLWLKSQTGLSTMVFQDMTGDGSGNVYLSGKYNAGGGNFNAMTRKLNASGTVLFTKTYGTPAYDDALGIATISGSEIYVTGETQGSLAHSNYGGRDGYLRKLSSSGDPVWTR